MIERGTRFVHLMHAGWDQHKSLTSELYTQCMDTDQPSAALVRDLKMRGLLEDTFVIQGGEFGRTPFIQGDLNDRPKWGRDHHPYGFTIWMAGGVKAGLTHGETDDIGFNVIKEGIHVHDFQATLIHLLGIDHEKLTYKFRAVTTASPTSTVASSRPCLHEFGMTNFGFLIRECENSSRRGTCDCFLVIELEIALHPDG